MDFKSFLTSLGTSFLIFLVLMFLFTWLSRKPGNYVVYYPNRILKGLDPFEGGKRTRNPLSWIREAVSSSEADVIRMSSVDSAVYFVFLSTVLGILVISSFFLLPVLLPVAATDNTLRREVNATSVGTFNDLDRLSIGHVGEKKRLWAFLIATYLITFVTLFLLWKAYKHVSDMRATALLSPEVKPEQFAVLVRDIPNLPEGQSRKEQVDSYFRTIYPETFYRSMVVTDNKKVNKIYEELEGYKKKLARAEAIFQKSKDLSNPEGTRPMNRTGFLGLVGKKVDSINFYNEKINELIPKLEAEQKVTLREKQLPAALVFFTSRVAAASAAQSLHAQMLDKWTVMAAPEPRDLIWTNLPKKIYERQIRQLIIYTIVFLTIFFYMIPIAAISAFTNLKNLKKILPFTKPIVNQDAVRTILEAYLPQIVLIVFLALLPKLLLFLSKAECITSESHAIRAASGKYFYFIVLNVFIGVTLSSSLFDTLKKLEHDPNSVDELLATSLPKSATFFLTFVALRFFVGYGLELSRLVPLIIFHIKKKYLCKTEAEVKEAWAPGDLGYATRFPADMLIFTIVLCYSVIAPIIVPFGVVYFGLGWLLLRNQVLKVYVPSFESYGRMWPHMFSRMIAVLILYQFTMIGYFGVNKFKFAPLMIPLPVLSLIFFIICDAKFYRSFKFTVLEVACQDLKHVPNMEIIFRSFVPPSLSAEKSDDEQFEDALSQVSRTASSL